MRSKLPAPYQPGPTVSVLIDNRKSMLGPGRLPSGYSLIETDADAAEAALKPNPRERIIRVHIIWDNTATNFPLGDVLDRMRETGAAMVVKAEEVTE